jgi:arylsulfatase
LLAAVVGCSSVDERLPVDADIVVITVDTLRADHLSCHGHERRTSPRIDALAAEGVRFRHAISQAPWTLPAMATLHTGLYPSEHLAVRNDTSIHQDAGTLAEALRSAGYHTVGVISHYFVGSKYGFARGFVEFDESSIGEDDVTNSAEVTHRALQQVEAAPGDAPFFLWVHYFDPHYVYLRHPEIGFADDYSGPLRSVPLTLTALEELQEKPEVSQEDLQYIKDVYDEEIASTDHWIGELLDGVRGVRGARPTLIVLTADHGEYFLERGRFGHGLDIFEELVHVPLIIAGDDRLRGREVVETVEVRGVARTILNHVGIEAEGIGGDDLLAVALGHEEAPALTYTEGSQAWGKDKRKVGALLGDYKLIQNQDDTWYSLYRWRGDVSENPIRKQDQSAGEKVVREDLELAIRSFRERARTDGTGHVELTDEELERLRALGYVQ